nr:MAG: RNA-dependent RNA polymerase [Riboviria sp.]
MSGCFKTLVPRIFFRLEGLMQAGTKPKRQPGRRKQAQRPAPPSGPSGVLPLNPITTTSGRGRKTSRPSTRNSKQNMVLHHDIIGPFQTTFIATTVPAKGVIGPIDLCPGSLPFGTIPRQLAGSFQRYYVHTATATFSSACPYTVGGQMVMWWDNDPDDNISVSSEQVASIAASHRSAIIFPPTTSRSIRLPPKYELEFGRLQPDEHFFFTSQGPERRTWVQAQLWIRPLIEPSETTIGTLTIHATYYFSNPGLTPPPATSGMGVTMLLSDWFKIDNSAFVTIHVDEAKRRTDRPFRYMTIRVTFFTKTGKTASNFITTAGTSGAFTSNPVICTHNIDLNASWTDEGHAWWKQLGTDAGFGGPVTTLGNGTDTRAGLNTECFMVATPFGLPELRRLLVAPPASVAVSSGRLDRVGKVARVDNVVRTDVIGVVESVDTIKDSVAIEGANSYPVVVAGLRDDRLDQLISTLHLLASSLQDRHPDSASEDDIVILDP